MNGLIPVSSPEGPEIAGDVVFVHGLDGDATSTWRLSDKPDTFWPRWVGEDIPNVRVWSLGYAVSASAWRGTTMPLKERATHSLNLLTAKEIGQRPLVFVCHSLGGLLVKQMLRHLHDERDRTWAAIDEQTQGIVFLSTPHSGVKIASWTDYLALLLRPTVSIKELRAKEPELLELNKWYRNKADRLRIRTQAYFEKQKTRGILVVDKETADPNIPNVDPIPIAANHKTICKPASRESDVYTMSKHFIEKCFHELELAVEPGKPSPSPPEVATAGPEKISTASLPVTGKHLFGREQELEQLDRAWADGETNVISLVAWGGVGKSALVNHWLGNLATEDYRGARRVYGVSFYSQGTRETAASADTTIDEALRWFDDPDPTEGSPWDKGERLARLVRQEPTLLILDGLEPLQNPPGPDEGRLKDPALQSLVRELAASNPGLCVITTRQRVADIDHLASTTAPLIELENLSDVAGAQLLRTLGVDGPEHELQQASREFNGHGLALNLLGTYLRDVCGGDVRRRNEVRLLEEDKAQGGHAKRVMESYENWFGEGPELSVLRILGLFDRPAEAKAVAAVREPPPIPGLTDALQDLSDVTWRQTLAKLRRAGLVAQEDPNDPDTLDAHPLVREHFGQQLRDEHAQAWREGNNRLYEHYKQAAPDLPDTLEDMAPLFAAVAHGCAAGRHQEARDDVYRDRIQRGDEFFSSTQLGAAGACLAALARFFDPPWRRPVTALTEFAKGYVLSEAGFYLRALGRLKEAAEPMQASLEAAKKQEDWKNAAIGAGNLSDLYLTIGDLAQALAYGQQTVELSDRSDDIFSRWSNRVTLAAALHQAGRLEEAKALFQEAEAMLKESESAFSLLYSTGSFRYCDLLLDQGKHQEVQDRAGQTLELATERELLLDIALDHVSLGRAHLAEAQQEGMADFAAAVEHLDQAVDGLRQAGTQHHIPRGLLARAALHRVRDKLDRAQRDVGEAMSIAERGGMGLFQADAHLEYVRLYLAMGEKPEAWEHLATAKEMIGRMGYHRRDKEVEELEEEVEK
ncbi:MAG: NACHT domain-containing protein [Proteobacteria bacterium]|nr:NACHT domain-containing protein [Pseudomonadota bacterium]